MVRSLWSAATGMRAQQTNVDNIANNVANVNTLGYKAKKAEFKSLLYQTLQTESTNNAGENKPIPAQVGTGTRIASITSSYAQGNLLASDNPYSIAIEGSGFFKVRRPNGEIGYTRDGNMKISPHTDGNHLVSSEGYAILDQNNNPIIIPPSTTMRDNEGNIIIDSANQPVRFELLINKLTIDSDGSIYVDTKGSGIDSATGEKIELSDHGINDATYRLTNVANNQQYNVTLGLVQFNNPQGLTEVGGNVLAESAVSGAPMEESATDGLASSKTHQYYIEGSNVQVADEVVNLIVAQRAYEMNSKMIQTTDDMMQQANNLR